MVVPARGTFKGAHAKSIHDNHVMIVVMIPLD